MADSLFDLTGKVAVITGSTRGIGRAIAEAMARSGAQVVISSRKAEKCAEVAQAIKNEGWEATAIACNIGKREDLERLVSETKQCYGSIDSLVCNAAVNPYFGSLAEAPDEAFTRIMDTNVRSNLWLCNLVIPEMAERGDGSVIIVSSIGGLKGSSLLGLYCISKAADMQLARNLAVEWGSKNVRVNCIAPGLVRTDFARALWEDPKTLARAEASYPLGRIGEPERLPAWPCCWHLVPVTGSTGRTIVIDGGATIAGPG